MNGPFSWDWQGISVGSHQFQQPQHGNDRRTTLGSGPWWLINSTVGYDVSKNFKVRLIVDNVFNKQPPFPALAGTGGNFMNADDRCISRASSDARIWCRPTTTSRSQRQASSGSREGLPLVPPGAICHGLPSFCERD